MARKSTDPANAPLPRSLASDLGDVDYGDEDEDEEVVEHVDGGPDKSPTWKPPALDSDVPATAPDPDEAVSTLRPPDDTQPPTAPEPKKPRPVVITQTRGAETPPPPKPKPTPKPKPKPSSKSKGRSRSLADRARRPVSVQEALKAEQARVKAREEAAAPPAPADLVQMACAALGEVQIRKIHILDDRKRLAERWLAHRARGVVRGDFHLAVTAEVIMDAAARVPRGRLFGVELDHEGRLYAAIVDAERVVLLAFLEGPSIYLGT